MNLGGLWGGFLKTSTMWGLVWGFAIRGLVVQKVVDNCGKVRILLVGWGIWVICGVGAEKLGLTTEVDWWICGKSLYLLELLF